MLYNYIFLLSLNIYVTKVFLDRTSSVPMSVLRLLVDRGQSLLIGIESAGLQSANITNQRRGSKYPRTGRNGENTPFE